MQETKRERPKRRVTYVAGQARSFQTLCPALDDLVMKETEQTWDRQKPAAEWNHELQQEYATISAKGAWDVDNRSFFASMLTVEERKRIVGEIDSLVDGDSKKSIETSSRFDVPVEEKEWNTGPSVVCVFASLKVQFEPRSSELQEERRGWLHQTILICPFSTVGSRCG
jgi:hypothetical protein